MGFSSNLKAARERAHLTQRDLAKQSGVSQQAISVIEKGGRSPSEATMKLLADALGCSVADLMGEEAQGGADYALTADERKLIDDYRSMNKQGQEYIRQTMYMAVPIYIRHADNADMESGSSEVQKIG